MSMCDIVVSVMIDVVVLLVCIECLMIGFCGL